MIVIEDLMERGRKGRTMRRRRPRGNTGAGWMLAVLVTAQVVLTGWVLTAGGVALLVLGELLIAALGVLVLMYRRYLRYRRSFESDLARRARARERGELAEELHDVLGHELSLIALRAGALQVTSTGAASEQAAAVRAQVEQAVLQLRQTVRLLRPDDVPEVAPPSGWHLAGLITRARDAGATIAVDGDLGDVPAPVRLTAYRVVQECVTNAAKHSPGAPVGIRLTVEGDSQLVTVTTAGEAGEDTGGWSGLARLERRVRALNGELSVRGADGTRVTFARIPFPGSPSDNAPPADDPPVRRPGAATLRWVFLPALGAIGVLLAFHTWATYATVVERDRFVGLTAGQPVASAKDLPQRQAPVRLLVPADPIPSSWRCRYFTDGNFPLGVATFQVCDDGETLTRVHDLRREPWR
ncbi:histidine kinase [Streptosporangium sp. NPDC048865]|uniref:sensor histidine kinase n=1 Tax=Streptosporangium sp. NPDC048865 TaxID=3155766 RepID=UPI0034429040